MNGMLVHHRSFPRNLLGFPNNLLVPIYLGGERHNTVSQARARTWTARSRHERTERTNHEATVPPASNPLKNFLIWNSLGDV